MWRSSLASFAFVAFFSAADATAAVRSVSGTLAVQIGALPPIAIPGFGTAIVNASSGVGHLGALDLLPGAFGATSIVLHVTDPAAAPIRGVQLTAVNGAGGFTGVGGSGSFGGVMPLSGVAKVCLFGPCSAAVSNLQIPLSIVGAGGYEVVIGGVYMTVVGAPWTTGTVAVGTITAMGGVAPASNTDAITLVTPILISSDISASPLVPAFGFLTLSGLSIPEPGTATLLAMGIAALVVTGRRARRR
jgi:hypothetical protein